MLVVKVFVPYTSVTLPIDPVLYSETHLAFQATIANYSPIQTKMCVFWQIAGPA
jgi:hypothetical protein